MCFASVSHWVMCWALRWGVLRLLCVVVAVCCGCGVMCWALRWGVLRLWCVLCSHERVVFTPHKQTQLFKSCYLARSVLRCYYPWLHCKTFPFIWNGLFVMDAKPVFKCVYVLCPWTDSGCVSRARAGLIHPHPVYYVQSCLVSLSRYKLFEEVSEGRNK